MTTMKDIIEHCKKNPGAFTCEFPFRDPDIQGFGRLIIKNPFFTEKKGEEALQHAAEGLFTAPQRLREIADGLREVVADRWEKDGAFDDT